MIYSCIHECECGPLRPATSIHRCARRPPPAAAPAGAPSPSVTVRKGNRRSHSDSHSSIHEYRCHKGALLFQEVVNDNWPIIIRALPISEVAQKCLLTDPNMDPHFLAVLTSIAINKAAYNPSWEKIKAKYFEKFRGKGGEGTVSPRARRTPQAVRVRATSRGS